MRKKINRFKNRVLNLIFPNNIKCVFCSEELNQNEYNKTCERCMEILPFITNPCDRCGSQMNENQQGVCLRCKSRNLNFVKAKSVFEYVEYPLNVVHNIKYNGKLYLVEHVAKYLLDAYSTWNLFADIVTNVPMFPLKEKERGYNQSSLIAKEFAERANLQYLELCAKVVDTASQTTLNTSERIKNVEDCFAFKPEMKSKIKNKVVLIIDDVITTGATVSELSKVILNAGAKECYVLSFAHTNVKQMQFEESQDVITR